MNVFDRNAKRLQKNRAASAPDAATYDYLRDEVASSVVDRACDVSRHFPVALDLGCGRGHVAKHMSKDIVGALYQSDMAERAVLSSASVPDDDVTTYRVVADEENVPFQSDTFDLVTSCLSLHWVNDLPGTLGEIKRILKPDSPVIGCMFAGDTLYELRCSLQLAETEVEGGFSPRISPFVALRDLGGLLTGAGFSLVTVDTDEIQIGYPSMHQLLQDLKGMGETNCAWNRRNTIRRSTLQGAAKIYREKYGDADGNVMATFQLIYFIGWKPDPSQAQPARRGSATVSLKDLTS